MSEIEVSVEVPEEEPPVIEAEPAVEAAAAGVAVAEAAVALSEQVTAAAELEAAALEVVGNQEDAAWRNNLETSIFSRLTELETRTMTALEALALRVETLSIPQAPLIVETPAGEEAIIPAEVVEQAQASGEAVSQEAQIRPKRHRWI